STSKISLQALSAVTDFSVVAWTSLPTSSARNYTSYVCSADVRLLARPGTPTTPTAMYASVWLNGTEYVLQPTSGQSNLNTWVHWVLTRSDRKITRLNTSHVAISHADLRATATANLNGWIGAQGGTASYR